MVQAYLPADQGQLLIKAAITVMVVQSECMTLMNSRETKDKNPIIGSNSSDNLGATAADKSSILNSVKLLDSKTIEDPAGTLMSNVGVDVSKSNLQAIDVNKLQRQV